MADRVVVIVEPRTDVVRVLVPGPQGQPGPGGTVAGVPASGGDYPAAALAAALGPLIGGGSYLHTQSTAATTWTINHNLGAKPVVELRGPGGSVLWSNVTHVSVNQVVVTHAVALAGSAYLTL